MTSDYTIKVSHSADVVREITSTIPSEFTDEEIYRAVNNMMIDINSCLNGIVTRRYGYDHIKYNFTIYIDHKPKEAIDMVISALKNEGYNCVLDKGSETGRTLLKISWYQ